MNHGPLIFLAAFFALASSWFGFVLTPQMQLGHLQQTNTLVAAVTYPIARPGGAHQGLQVYRVNGCASCHTLQLEQTGTVCDAVLAEAGTNTSALIAAIRQVKPSLSEAEASQLIREIPRTVLEGASRQTADFAVKTLSSAGAKSMLRIRPVGPDIGRGWGRRRTVAEDFLFDYPVLLGSQRIGPDLSNVGLRQPDLNWHLRHLYAPGREVKDSSMPPYRFLFEKRKIYQSLSPEALRLPPDLAPPPGYEVVPTTEARALAAYLVSLHADAPLFDAPLTPPPAAPSATPTNPPSRSAVVSAAASTVKPQ